MVEEPKKDFKAVKEYFKDLNNMKTFLKDCPEFNKNFELLKYVNSGSCGIIFEGKIKKNNNKMTALKFLMGKMIDEKREKKQRKKEPKEKK